MNRRTPYIKKTSSKGALLDKDDSWKSNFYFLLQLHELHEKEERSCKGKSQTFVETR